MSIKIKPAFTLIEILLVIAILAVFTTMALAVIDPVKSQNHTRDAVLTDVMKDVASAFELFKLAEGNYPENADFSGSPSLVSKYLNTVYNFDTTQNLDSDPGLDVAITSNSFRTGYSDESVRYYPVLECMDAQANVVATSPNYLIWMPDCKPNIFVHTAQCEQIASDISAGTATYCN